MNKFIDIEPEIYNKLHFLKKELESMDSLSLQCDCIFNFFDSEFKLKNLEFRTSIDTDILFKSFYNLKRYDLFFIWDFAIEYNNIKIELYIKIYFETNEQYKKFEEKYSYINEIISELSAILKVTMLLRYYEIMFTIDDTTNVFNRKFLFGYLDKILPLIERQNEKLGFLMINIDHFKAVIEEYNYEIADKVLKSLAFSLKDSVRESDVVARLGSDNFIIVLPKVENDNDLITISNKCINKFADMKIAIDENQYIQKTVSIGSLLYPDDAKNKEDIFRNLDIALVEAQNLGRGKMYKFSDVKLGVCNFF